MPPTPDYLGALAALRDGGRHRTHPGDRPRRLRLDVGITLEAPGPRVVAAVLALPWLTARGQEVLRPRSGPALLVRCVGTDDEPQPLDLHALAADLGAVLAALPDRPDAGRPYRDARDLARHAEPATRDAYLLDVVRYLRRLPDVRTWTPPRADAPATEQPPATSPAQRKAAQRAREKSAEEDTARVWLRHYLTGWGEPDEVPAPGSRVPAPTLYSDAAAWAENVLDEYSTEVDTSEGSEWATYAAEEGYPLRPRPLGRTCFYRTADGVLGARRTIRGTPHYVIPSPKEPAMDLLAERVIDRAAEILAEDIRRLYRSGARRDALLLQRDRLAATGTDGAVVDLNAARVGHRAPRP